jgi:hypothetical protein
MGEGMMGDYPANDNQFEDKAITRVEAQSDGTYAVTWDDGFSLWLGKDCPVIPKVGQIGRMYGHGIGSPVRGLFIDGVRVWYRTEAEEKEHREIQSYGADAADWLDRWDSDKGIWSISMGWLGPGYEQAIQVTTAEIVRWFLTNKPDVAVWENRDIQRQVLDEMEAEVIESPAVKVLGLSGAQWGAAVNLAAMLYNKGPRSVMTDERVKDRHIQVSRRFPGMTA